MVINRINANIGGGLTGPKKIAVNNNLKVYIEKSETVTGLKDLSTKLSIDEVRLGKILAGEEKITEALAKRIADAIGLSSKDDQHKAFWAEKPIRKFKKD